MRTEWPNDHKDGWKLVSIYFTKTGKRFVCNDILRDTDQHDQPVTIVRIGEPIIKEFVSVRIASKN